MRLRRNALATMREKLEQCIERQELNAGAFEDFLTRPLRKHLLHHALRSLIAITNRRLDEIAGRVEQSVVHSPTINAHAANLSSEFTGASRGITQAVLYLNENPGKVPTKVAGSFDRWIMKATNLLK